MVLLPKISIEEQINDLIEDNHVEEYHRWYIGYSGLGNECKRKIWYSFRWVKLRQTSARIIRLFSRGDWEEHRLVNDLKKIGFKHHSDQLELVGLAGHVLGHIDGILEHDKFFPDEQILSEFKTANDKRFNLFKKNGCKETEKAYYGQAQSYMGKLGLNKCLFCVTNKNDERRYFEIIEFDQNYYDELESIAFAILTSDAPLDKIGPPTWFSCRFCEFKKICHYSGNILTSCRSCKYGTIEEKGEWSCGLNNITLSLNDQKNACSEYELLETLK